MFSWRRRYVTVHYEMPIFVPIAIQVRAHDLIEAGQLREAARVLAKQAQLPRRDAAEAAEVLRSGGVLADFPMPDRADLKVRVQELRDSGRRKEAVFTVRSERKLTTADAEAVVESA